jgi:beta-phosphoglucomutase-like phosphatase (HAD superfamily)
MTTYTAVANGDQRAQCLSPSPQAVLFDMDGVLTASEHLSRRAAAAVFLEMYGLRVEEEEFVPFGGQGEDRFLGGMAQKYSVQVGKWARQE